MVWIVYLKTEFTQTCYCPVMGLLSVTVNVPCDVISRQGWRSYNSSDGKDKDDKDDSPV